MDSTNRSALVDTFERSSIFLSHLGACLASMKMFHPTFPRFWEHFSDAPNCQAQTLNLPGIHLEKQQSENLNQALSKQIFVFVQPQTEFFRRFLGEQKQTIKKNRETES